MALTMFQHEHDALPYDQRGPEFALYPLKAYFPEELSGRTSEMMLNEAVDLSYYEKELPFVFDDGRQVVLSEFEYINEPKATIDPAAHQSVIVATRLTPNNLTNVMCFTSTGQFYRLRLDPEKVGSLDRLVGKPLAHVAEITEEVIDFCAGDYAMWPIPFQRVAAEVKSRIDIERLAFALGRYRNVHGSFPSDARGPEYALYKLKEFDVGATFVGELPSALLYEESHHKVLDPPFNYLNEPVMALSRGNVFNLLAADKKPFTRVHVGSQDWRTRARFSRIITIKGDVCTYFMDRQDEEVGSYLLNRLDPRLQSPLDGPYIGGSHVGWWNYRSEF